MTFREVCQLAQNLARECDWPVFPCRADKKPATPGFDGNGGYKLAGYSAPWIENLWRDFPGELIGIPTGTRSGFSVLDIDSYKHPTAGVWWRAHCHLLLPTRVYQTRRGGLHVYLQHREAVTNSQNKISDGVDTRGEGGYVIAWHAHGFACLDPSPPAPWPDWLFSELKREPPQPRRQASASPPNAADAVARIIHTVRHATEGKRNGILFWAANRLADRGLQHKAVEDLLHPAATDAGLPDCEVRRTIASAMRRVSA